MSAHAQRWALNHQPYRVRIANSLARSHRIAHVGDRNVRVNACEMAIADRVDGGRGAGGTSTGPQPEEAPATIAARRLLGLVVRLRSAGLAVCALDVALVGASDKQGHGELQWNQLSCMQVALALRGRFASGAGHATAQEAQALDTAGWAAALRAAVDDVE